MKQTLFLLLLQATLVSAQSKNISLLDNWQDTSLISNSSQVRYSGLWTFSKGTEEYAVVGTTEGASFLQLLENNEVSFIDHIDGKYVSTQAITREYKRYQNYIYAVSYKHLTLPTKA